MLLRVMRRWVDDDVQSAEELRKLLFSRKDGTPDLNLSVYEADVGKEAQVHAEHAAAVPLDLRKSFAHMDASGFAPPVATPVPISTIFAFTSRAHSELQFSSPAELDAFAERVLRRLASAQILVQRQAVQDHVCSRLAAQDPEWTAFSEKPQAKSWIKACPPPATPLAT